MKKIISILVLLCVLFGGMSLASAQDGGEVQPGVPLKGTAAGQSVTHTFTATAGQFVIINLMSDAFDPRLTLLDASGAELASDDDGGIDYDSLIAFVAPTDGTYQLLVDSWSTAEGDYVLSVDPVSATSTNVGETVSLTPSETTALYATFNGTANQVVNVLVTSQGDEDTRLRFLGSDGQVLWQDDDGGVGSNPYLRRVVLPSDGAYFIEITPFGDESLTSNVDVMVEATENLTLGSTPQEVTIDSDQFENEVLTLETVSGTIYRIQVQVISGDGVRVEIETDDDFFTPSMEITQGVGATWDYQATSSGALRVSVSPTFFSDGGTYQISAEPVQ